jgi:alpha-galactosidase
MWNNIIFANDPDVIFIRNENCTLTKDQKKLIAFVDELFGSQLMYSDDPESSCSEEEVALAKEIVDFQKKYSDEEFGLCNRTEDIYEIFSKSGKYKGIIDLKKTEFTLVE